MIMNKEVVLSVNVVYLNVTKLRDVICRFKQAIRGLHSDVFVVIMTSLSTNTSPITLKMLPILLL